MFLLDTEVVSELRKVAAGKGHKNVVRWAQGLVPAQAFISSITVHELEFGVLLLERKDQKQGAILREWLDERVLVEFEGRILPVDASVALRCAVLDVPDPKPMRDALIAATALVHQMVVVTRNVKDFDAMGIEIVNPWT